MGQAGPSERIVTRRLLLRCWRPEDAALLKHAIDGSLDHLRAWMPWAMEEPSALPVLEARLAKFRDDFLSGTEWLYGIFDSAEHAVLGGAGLHPRQGPGILEIGYWVRADVTGLGYATEAAAALTRAGFADPTVERMEIRCDPRNLRSAAVPRRLGYRHAGTLERNTTTPGGQMRDTMVWELTRQEFSRVRPTLSTPTLTNEEARMEEPDWLASLFPWEQRAVTVNGRRMSYIDEGPRDGRPVLLLSGNPTWGFLYRDFIAPLTAEGFRTIAPDWIGAGYSDHPRVDAALSFAHHIADLVSLIDQLELNGFVVVGQDWGGPQGTGAALQRLDRLSALILMSTWLFNGHVGPFHSSPRPWTTWHAPLIGQYFMKRNKVLSHGGPSVISRRGMTELEARAYHHVFDEPDSDHVVLTWPRTIPMREGDRGWADMATIESRLSELAETPTLLLYAAQDSVFGKPYADRLKQLLPHAEGPLPIEGADHFLQDDCGPEVAAAIADFLRRSIGSKGQPGAVSPRKSPEPRPGEWKLEFVAADPDELAALRADPLLVEQELDVRPEVAEALERAVGFRAGRTCWRSAHGSLYALELADFGRGRPSMATVYGLWPRWEPRPPEAEIDRDLFDFCLWVAAIAPGIEPSNVSLVAQHAGLPRA